MSKRSVEISRCMLIDGTTLKVGDVIEKSLSQRLGVLRGDNENVCNSGACVRPRGHTGVCIAAGWERVNQSIKILHIWNRK